MTHHYTVMFGGVVLTVDGAAPSDAATRSAGRPDVPDAAGRRATAICCAHDRVLAVGSDEDILALAGPSSTRVDLVGRCVIPGFVDPHAHPLWEGIVAARPTLEGTSDLRAALRAVAGLAARLEPDAWLVARYAHAEWPEARHPTRAELDRAVPDRPVVLTHVSGHAAAANSLALALAGIEPARPGSRQAAGLPADAGLATVERDEAGQATGVVHGPDAWSRFAGAMPALDPAAAVAALRLAGERLAADGVTSVADADVGATAGLDAEMAAYAAAATGRLLAQRVSLLPGLLRLAPAADSSPPPPAEVAAAVPAAARDRLGVVGAKLYADGALSTHSAWLTEAYADDPAATGRPAIESAELAERVRRAAAAGWSVAIHAIGDAAIEAALAAYGASPGLPPRRHRLEHALVLGPGQIAALARLGVAAVVQPEFMSRFADVYRARLGEGRAARLGRYSELLAAGAPLAFSSDRPVVAGPPLAGIRAALAQAARSGAHPSDDLPAPSVAEAFHAWTAAGAALLGDRDGGRLAPGYRADLVVLSGDPTAVPAAAWAVGHDGVRVLATLAAGRLASGQL